MDEQALRAMVREAVARHLANPSPRAGQPMQFFAHASHCRYELPQSDGPCLIEPDVQCIHCGYCESHGH